VICGWWSGAAEHGSSREYAGRQAGRRGVGEIRTVWVREGNMVMVLCGWVEVWICVT